MSDRLNKTATFASLPPPWPEDLRPQIRAAAAARPEHKIVVIDDDPTGTQTVHDVPVLTSWEVETLRAEFNADEPSFYVLTNSRSLPAEDARALTLDLAKNLRAAAGSRSFTVVSRSDSTLRGHFPVETDALDEVLGPFDATLLIPYFEDGGRYTINDTHYIAEGDTLIPTSETAFARDAVFGYRSSHLPTYVQEKSNGRIKAREVQSISLAEVRRGPDAVTARLLSLPRASVTIVNAAAPADLDVFVMGLLAAEAQGRRFCFRTAAQFPAARLGLEPRPLLTAHELELTSIPIKRTGGGPSSRESSLPSAILPAGETHRKPAAIVKPEVESERERTSVALPNAGGLIVVGSHVPATTRQLAELTGDERLLQIELRVDQLLTARRREHLAHVSAMATQALAAGQDVLVFTSRKFLSGDTPVRTLQIGSRITDALIELVRTLEVRPRFIVAKGGITSSDIATRALGVKRAVVLGQLLPGVPVWRLGLETKFPAMTYVVFPGNVGGPTALAEALQILNSTETRELKIVDRSHSMKIAVLGAGAMGSAIGALLHKAGHQVTLVDVSRPAIEAIQSRGLIIQNKAGEQETLRINITDNPASIGFVDMLLVFVKCYHTEAAVKSALPIIGPNTIVLSLQNGWGNGPRIASLVGKERVILGVCYHSATVLAPGHVLHAGQGTTYIGEWDSESANWHGEVFAKRCGSVAAIFSGAGLDVIATAHVLKEIWSKLALNVATLPTSSTIRVTADHLLDTPEMQELMKGLLHEVVAVASAQNIPLDFNERWEAITGLLRKLAPNTKGSMLQDVEARRQTEIDVMSGAIIEAGTRLNIPTPYNRAMLGLIKGLEATFRLPA